MSPHPEYSLDPRTYLRLSQMISDRSGLSYDEKSRSTLARRLSARVAELGLADFGQYLEYLERSPEEFEEIYQLLTTKETYFFRQEYQLTAFVDELLPRIVENGGGHSRLTVWSAGCSTGEEAYTLAMLLGESPHLRGWKVNILGTDLCRSNIEHAERGLYRPGSFRTMSEELVDKHFERQGSSMQISAALRRMVHFSVSNLVDPVDVRAVGRVDVIFCRNVLIYFDEKARNTATSLFYERLLPGGYLLLGHSESLLNADTLFEPVHLEGDLVYRRPPLDRGSSSRMRVSK